MLLSSLDHSLHEGINPQGWSQSQIACFIMTSAFCALTSVKLLYVLYVLPDRVEAKSERGYPVQRQIPHIRFPLMLASGRERTWLRAVL